MGQASEEKKPAEVRKVEEGEKHVAIRLAAVGNEKLQDKEKLPRRE